MKVLIISLVIITLGVGVYFMFGSSNTSDKNKHNFVIVSEFKGQLVDGSGSPVVGQTVTRKFRQGPNSAFTTHTATTNETGHFSFPKVTLEGWWKNFASQYIPGTPSVKIEITTERDGEEKELFFMVKNDFEDGGELGRVVDDPTSPSGRSYKTKPIDLVCNIDKEPNAEGPAWGTCVER